MLFRSPIFLLFHSFTVALINEFKKSAFSSLMEVPSKMMRIDPSRLAVLSVSLCYRCEVGTAFQCMEDAVGQIPGLFFCLESDLQLAKLDRIGRRNTGKNAENIVRIVGLIIERAEHLVDGGGIDARTDIRRQDGFTDGQIVVRNSRTGRPNEGNQLRVRIGELFGIFLDLFQDFGPVGFEKNFPP